MKKTLQVLLGIAAYAATICGTFAAERPQPSEPPRKQAAKTAQWNVRVEVMMVAMTQDKAIALLPDLRAPDKIDGAVTQILSALERKEATLMGWPVAYTLDGVRCVIETILEKRYPTEFDLPLQQQHAATPRPDANSTAHSDSPVSTAFETRNLGVTLEIEPNVLSNGEWIHIPLVAQRVALQGFDSYDAVKTQSGGIVKMDQPQFYTTKTSTTVTLRNGQRSLLAIHKLPQPENQIEFFIVQASASPSK